MSLYVLTILRFLPAFIAIVLSLKEQRLLACAMLVISVWMDFFVGLHKKTAKFNGNYQLHLEGFIDFASFGVAPALFVACLDRSIFHSMCVFIFLVACIVRITRFNCEGLIDGYYRGLPVTYNGYIIPAVYGIFYIIGLPQYSATVLAVVLSVASIAMVSSKIRIKEIG